MSFFVKPVLNMDYLALIEIELEKLQFTVGPEQHLAYFSMKYEYKCLNKVRWKTKKKPYNTQKTMNIKIFFPAKDDTLLYIPI